MCDDLAALVAEQLQLMEGIGGMQFTNSLCHTACFILVTSVALMSYVW